MPSEFRRMQKRRLQLSLLKHGSVKSAHEGLQLLQEELNELRREVEGADELAIRCASCTTWFRSPLCARASHCQL